jgi:hypothetical protein
MFLLSEPGQVSVPEVEDVVLGQVIEVLLL